MARPYRLTPARRAAIIKAQKASARKRKRNRNIKIGAAAAGATAALVGAGIYRHKKSGSSLTVRSLGGDRTRTVTGNVAFGVKQLPGQRHHAGTIKRGVLSQTPMGKQDVPFGVRVGRTGIRNSKPVVRGTKVWLSGQKVSHNRYHATIGGFGRGVEISYTHSRYHAPWNRKTDLGMPTMPNPRRHIPRDQTVPFYKPGQSASWPRGAINPNSKKNKKKLKDARSAIYEVNIIPRAKKKRK